jgi:hypothetical protein
LLMPLSMGPRHCGQFSAFTAWSVTIKQMSDIIDASSSLWRISLLSSNHQQKFHTSMPANPEASKVDDRVP